MRSRGSAPGKAWCKASSSVATGRKVMASRTLTGTSSRSLLLPLGRSTVCKPCLGRRKEVGGRMQEQRR